MYKIQVTKEDIAKGIPQKEASCPIARAVRRVVGHRKVEVNYAGEILVDNKEYETPANILGFITNFDNAESRKLCRPFSFILKKVD